MINKVIFGTLIVQILLSIGLIFTPFIDSPHDIWALCSGALLSWGNFVTLISFYVLVFQKKRVALGIFIVVIKYAILGFLLWYFLTQSSLPQAEFLGGIVLNPASVIIFSLFGAKKIAKNRG